ncbi:hypothetical protein [Bradyrhizobium roseum]|uniref:hypothetical protein n=1 Tax=Bradyrhizobium roseum TaxID=3056648 RepID=UPI002616E92E|nr:hypothetical protein [Bradyrhizobium roseus]WKA31736.1 hypothetical protein QUH67_16940 [Bradyrhizobium roseus]
MQQLSAFDGSTRKLTDAPRNSDFEILMGSKISAYTRCNQPAAGPASIIQPDAVTRERSQAWRWRVPDLSMPARQQRLDRQQRLIFGA